MEKRKTAVLSCALADEAPFSVIGANFDRHCESCRGRVMMTPNSARLIEQRKDLDIHVLCILCAELMLALQQAQGNIPEVLAPERVAKRDLIANPWRQRN